MVGKRKRNPEKTDSVEMLKVRIYSQHSHGLIMAMLSFVLAFFISISVLLYTSVRMHAYIPMVWYAGFAMIVIFTFGAIIYIRRAYTRDLIKISNMIETIKQGKELPKLEELAES